MRIRPFSLVARRMPASTHLVPNLEMAGTFGLNVPHNDLRDLG
jgi:hypothetical protein